MPTPRRTCPACQRRYGGLVDDACPICHGTGALTLGTAALAHHPPAVVARSVELYLETHAHRFRGQLPPGQARAQALEATADDLRIAGVLASAADQARRPHHADTPDEELPAAILEIESWQTTADLGATVDGRAIHDLATTSGPIADVKPRTGLPTGSADGTHSAIAAITDPIDPLGPDAANLENQRTGNDRTARVLATATDHALDKLRRRRKAQP